MLLNPAINLYLHSAIIRKVASHGGKGFMTTRTLPWSYMLLVFGGGGPKAC